MRNAGEQVCRAAELVAVGNADATAVDAYRSCGAANSAYTRPVDETPCAECQRRVDKAHGRPSQSDPLELEIGSSQRDASNPPTSTASTASTLKGAPPPLTITTHKMTRSFGTDEFDMESCAALLASKAPAMPPNTGAHAAVGPFLVPAWVLMPQEDLAMVEAHGHTPNEALFFPIPDEELRDSSDESNATDSDRSRGGDSSDGSDSDGDGDGEVAVLTQQRDRKHALKQSKKGGQSRKQSSSITVAAATNKMLTTAPARKSQTKPCSVRDKRAQSRASKTQLVTSLPFFQNGAQHTVI